MTPFDPHQQKTAFSILLAVMTFILTSTSVPISFLVNIMNEFMQGNHRQHLISQIPVSRLFMAYHLSFYVIIYEINYQDMPLSSLKLYGSENAQCSLNN